MNIQIREFFRVDGVGEPHFQDVRFLSEEKALSWNDAEKMGLSRSWFELSRISVENRLEFTKGFWLKTLSFHPKATPVIENFFNQLDDVVVLVCRQTIEDPWRAELIYSMADNSTFFRGLSPASEEEIALVKKQLEPDLPSNFWAFSRLHNGFGRLSELGILPLEDLKDARDRLISSVFRSDKQLRMGEAKIDPYSLFPESEMGNVHFSGIDYTLSDTFERKEWAENLAFPTFLDWLAAFLEGMNSCI
jgi:hypothetical protein